LISFFEDTFPDALKLMGRELLVKEYFKNPKGSLISVKCKPYHYKDRLVLVGDAAHAMVPFYGQGMFVTIVIVGMNCGFEDLSVLTQVLEKYLGPVEDSPTTDFLSFKPPSASKIQAALDEYSKVRNPDAEAMCDLALHNYEEMRSSVVKPLYLIRKKLEGFLNYFFPNRVIPLYTMVSFTRLPYSMVVKNYESQNRVYSNLYQGAINIGMITVIGMGIWFSLARPRFPYKI
jgi:kynurenine 3-monooxygenase